MTKKEFKEALDSYELPWYELDDGTLIVGRRNNLAVQFYFEGQGLGYASIQSMHESGPALHVNIWCHHLAFRKFKMKDNSWGLVLNDDCGPEDATVSILI